MKNKSIYWWVFLAFAIPYLLKQILYTVIGFHYKVFIDKFNILYLFTDLGVSTIFYGTTFYFVIKHFIKKYDDVEKKKQG